MTSSDPEAGLELVFRDVCVSVGEKQILKTVCGVVSPGQLMAVMGPSGKACGWIKGFCLIQAEYLSQQILHLVRMEVKLSAYNTT